MKRAVVASWALWATSSVLAAGNVVQVSNQITGLQLQVVDLTPEDGLAASAVPYQSYLQPDPSTYTSLQVFNMNTGTQGYDLIYDGTVFDPTEINRSDTAGSIVKNSSGIYVNTALDATAANNAIGTFQLNAGHPQYQNAIAGISPWGWLALTVAPHTAVSISANVAQNIEMDLSQLVGSAQWQPFLNAGYSLALSANIGFGITSSDFSSNFEEPHYNSTSQYLSGESSINELGQLTGGAPVSQSQNLELTFANDSDTEVVRYFSVSANTGYTLEAVAPLAPVEVPAIPEPSTYAFMALGLIGLGAIARRSRPATCSPSRHWLWRGQHPDPGRSGSRS